MKESEASEQAQAARHRLDPGVKLPPGTAALPGLPSGASGAESVEVFVTSVGFLAEAGEDDKYLAVLRWLAGQHAAEFAEFVRGETAVRHFSDAGRGSPGESARRNHARQIDGTQYWAVMNIPVPAKIRFLTRVLEFIGYRDAPIESVRVALGMRRKSSDRPLPSLVA